MLISMLSKSKQKLDIKIVIDHHSLTFIANTSVWKDVLSLFKFSYFLNFYRYVISSHITQLKKV